MMRFVRRGVLVVAIAGAFVLPGCDEEAVPPTALPTPPPAVRAVVATTSFDNYPTDIYLGIPIPLAQAGVLDFTVDWTFTSTDMAVAFGSQNCSFADLNARRCPFLVSSTGKTPKPRVLVTQPLAVGTYYLYLYSVPFDKASGAGSDNIEAVSLQIGLTVGPSVTPAAVPIEPIRLQPRFIGQ
jgi:hypothetical protein